MSKDRGALADSTRDAANRRDRPAAAPRRRPARAGRLEPLLLVPFGKPYLRIR